MFFTNEPHSERLIRSVTNSSLSSSLRPVITLIVMLLLCLAPVSGSAQTYNPAQDKTLQQMQSNERARVVAVRRA